MRTLALLLALVAGSASASEQIDFYEATPGESLDSFVLRIAPAAAAHGRAITAEVCGSVEYADDRYYMILGTSHSQLYCSVPALWLNAPIGISFHTHPKRRQDGRLELTASTRRQMSTEAVMVKLGHGFSDGDYEDGPGYLVEGTEVLFQAGRGQERSVGRVSNP